MAIAPSELILNADKSVYHLNLHPEHIAKTIITVGDLDRVDKITQHLENIRFSTQKREFKTTTGTYKGKEITVISTGIGTDNIDIVLNELDALVNIDLETKEIKKAHTSLDIIRVGTSGAIKKEIPVDSLLLSRYAVGFDALLHFYDSTHVRHQDMETALLEHMAWAKEKSTPYVVSCDDALAQKFTSDVILEGCTSTMIGFYAPQGRILRLRTSDTAMHQKLESFRFNQSRTSRTTSITNIEMETSGIYGLAKLLGHRAVSLNAILANRKTKTFSTRPEETMEKLIQYTLNCLVPD